MNSYGLERDDDFLEFIGFETQDNVVPTQLHVNLQPQTYEIEKEGVCGEVGNSWDDSEGGEISEDAYGSDDSFRCNDDLLTEELRYDDEEMYELRVTNRNLRSTQINRTWALNDEAAFHEQPLQQQHDRDDGGSSSKWPSYFTTYEGGYESDQRASDDEGGRLSDDNSDVDLPVLKRRKGIAYPMFNEKCDMRKVELSIGLRFVSREVFKEAILLYSIQQHKDLIYMKNDKMHIHLGCSLCKLELTAGPDLEDVSTPAEYVKTTRGHKGTRPVEDGGVLETSQPSWLQVVASRRGGVRRMSRGRGRITHGKSTLLPGIGICYGEGGEVIYRSSMTAPNIVINGPQMPSSSSPSIPLRR